MSDIPFSRKEFDQLVRRVAEIEKNIEPYILEQESKKVAQDKIIISCATNPDTNQISIVMRLSQDEPYITKKYIVKRNGSLYLEITAIYEAVDIFSKLFINYNPGIGIEIHTLSEECAKTLTASEYNEIDNFYKINIIKESIRALSLFRNSTVEVIYKKTSHDLNEAYQLLD